MEALRAISKANTVGFKDISARLPLKGVCKAGRVKMCFILLRAQLLLGGCQQEDFPQARGGRAFSAFLRPHGRAGAGTLAPPCGESGR